MMRAFPSIGNNGGGKCSWICTSEMKVNIKNKMPVCLCHQMSVPEGLFYGAWVFSREGSSSSVWKGKRDGGGRKAAAALGRRSVLG